MRSFAVLTGAVLTALSVTSADATVRIKGDPGGLMSDYASRFTNLRQNGESVVIDGPCFSACTMVRWDPRFPGPAALNRALTVVADSRDGDVAARWEALFGEDGVWRCHGQAQCTAVCPMELSPADAILRLRRTALRSLFLRV